MSRKGPKGTNPCTVSLRRRASSEWAAQAYLSPLGQVRPGFAQLGPTRRPVVSTPAACGQGRASLVPTCCLAHSTGSGAQAAVNAGPLQECRPTGGFNRQEDGMSGGKDEQMVRFLTIFGNQISDHRGTRRLCK